MIKFLKTYYPVLTGSLLGYLYYHYIGCWSGSCPLTGNPYISTIYGALLGSIFIFDKIKKKKEEKS